MYPALALLALLALALPALAIVWGQLRSQWHHSLAQRRLVRLVDCALPQTQCGQCGYPGCLPYASAMAAGRAPINRCPPGGVRTLEALAQLLPGAPLPLDARHGRHLPPRLARIDESLCIGCTKCIAACPTDAIIGATGYMHSVIDEHCSGCDLCLAPCPVDCIEMVPAAAVDEPASLLRPALYRRLFGTRNRRLERRARSRRQQRRPDLLAMLGRARERQQQAAPDADLERSRRAGLQQRLTALDERIEAGGERQELARWQAERRNLQHLLQRSDKNR